MTDEIKDYTEQLQELEPNCESLESNYTLLSEQYENTKKKMIGTYTIHVDPQVMESLRAEEQKSWCE